MTSLAVDKELFKKSFLGSAEKLSVGSDAGGGTTSSMPTLRITKEWRMRLTW